MVNATRQVASAVKACANVSMVRRNEELGDEPGDEIDYGVHKKAFRVIVDFGRRFSKSSR